jgi:hypothetical protein
MFKVTLIMLMSSEDAWATVVTGLHGIPGVELSPPRWTHDRELVVSIESHDPDLVDIVREITWQFDPLAIQSSMHLDAAS